MLCAHPINSAQEFGSNTSCWGHTCACVEARVSQLSNQSPGGGGCTSVGDDVRFINMQISSTERLNGLIWPSLRGIYKLLFNKQTLWKVFQGERWSLVLTAKICFPLRKGLICNTHHQPLILLLRDELHKNISFTGLSNYRCFWVRSFKNYEIPSPMSASPATPPPTGEL